MAVALAHLAPLHPAIHLAPPSGWMNDPNGLSRFDGLWHAYYQHHPDDDVWGTMHWRHATTSDLVNWTDHGIALAPCELGTIFSGSVVIDESNSAGFGAGAKVAIFTFDDDGLQRQGLAWSTDGYRWNMYDANPVLVDAAEKDFRDPKVLRYLDRWVMVLGVGAEVRFYQSDDLVEWRQVGAYRPEPTPVNPIECPDLVETRTADGEQSWIMMFSDDRGGPGAHGMTMGVAGTFDGSTFGPRVAPQPLDWGPDFYAGQSFYRSDPTRPPMMMAWMNSWPYANIHPSSGRRGVLSLPRRLDVSSGRSPSIRCALAVDIDSLFNVPVERSWRSEPGRALRVQGTVFELDVRGADGGGELSVQVDRGRVWAERSGLDLEGFQVVVESEPTDSGPGDVPVTVVVDHGTVEVFTADGRTISLLVFPGSSFVVDARSAANVNLDMRSTGPVFG